MRCEGEHTIVRMRVISWWVNWSTVASPPPFNTQHRIQKAMTTTRWRRATIREEKIVFYIVNSNMLLLGGGGGARGYLRDATKNLASEEWKWQSFRFSKRNEEYMERNFLPYYQFKLSNIVLNEWIEIEIESQLYKVLLRVCFIFKRGILYVQTIYIEIKCLQKSFLVFIALKYLNICLTFQVEPPYVIDYTKDCKDCNQISRLAKEI